VIGLPPFIAEGCAFALHQVSNKHPNKRSLDLSIFCDFPKVGGYRVRPIYESLMDPECSVYIPILHGPKRIDDLFLQGKAALLCNRNTCDSNTDGSARSARTVAARPYPYKVPTSPGNSYRAEGLYPCTGSGHIKKSISFINDEIRILAL
jgi:hypothetical protein